MFKKFICLYFFISITYTSYSQTFEDVLRYSSFYNEGTARFNSMGGDFGDPTAGIETGNLPIYDGNPFA